MTPLPRILPALLLALAALPAAPAAAQENLAQPAPWCLRWTDTCTICNEARERGAAACEAARTRRKGPCTPGPVRCVKADTAAVKESCESTRIVREACNVCSKDGRCTAMLCAVREIVCVNPRR
jgi:hypothetical protein